MSVSEMVDNNNDNKCPLSIPLEKFIQLVVVKMMFSNLLTHATPNEMIDNVYFLQ